MGAWRLLFVFSFILIGFPHSNGNKFEMIHRWRDLSQLERTKNMVQSDAVRLRAISNGRRKMEEVHNGFRTDCFDGSGGEGSPSHADRNAAGELPMRSGADYGTGQYFVEVRVGLPPQRLVLIPDTGSDLTWMNCEYRCHHGGCATKNRLYRGDRSLSFRTVPCASHACKVDLSELFSLKRCPSPMDPCSYDYRYGDGSSTVGLFAKETVTFSLTNGRHERVHDVLIGCSESSRTTNFDGADGVMGLGYSNYSFAGNTAHKFGGKFSYCLVDHLAHKNVSSYLILGSPKEVKLSYGKMHYTELVVGAILSFYAVNMKGISINGIMLEIPAETWNITGKGGMVVDSGASLTALSSPAYHPVVNTLKQSLVQFEKLDEDIGPLEYCFNSTGFKEAAIPRLVFHFEDGATFEPPVKSYVIDAAPQVKCLGFVESGSPGISIIGNIMQQNHYWEFDLVKSRLGFAVSSCS